MVTVDSALQIRNHMIKNRIAFAPTVKFFWSDPGGKVSARLIRHYEDRAEGGAGIIVVEATCVAPDALLSISQLGLWEDEQIEGHRKITDACGAYGAVTLLQIHHAGFDTPLDCSSPEGVFGPSAYLWKGIMAKEMSINQIHNARDQFIQAAQRAEKAGYNGIQLHGCHMYLLNQFVSPLTNRREDEYGGDTVRRCRLSCEIVQGIRDACGDDFIISARIPGADPDIAESCAVADRYIEAGVDMLQISFGFDHAEQEFPIFPALGETIKNGFALHRHINGRAVTSVVGGIRTPQAAKYIINHNMADLVDSAKALLADPQWANGVIRGTPYEPCRSCNPCLWVPTGKFRCPAVLARYNKEPDCSDYVDYETLIKGK